jgi:hypothetical protein
VGGISTQESVCFFLANSYYTDLPLSLHGTPTVSRSPFYAIGQCSKITTYLERKITPLIMLYGKSYRLRSYLCKALVQIWKDPCRLNLAVRTKLT